MLIHHEKLQPARFPVGLGIEESISVRFTVAAAKPQNKTKWKEDEATVSIAATKESSSFILTGLHFALDQEQKPANKQPNKLALKAFLAGEDVLLCCRLVLAQCGKILRHIATIHSG